MVLTIVVMEHSVVEDRGRIAYD